MGNYFKLTEGARYRVRKEFIDYDKKVHPVGEEWIFLYTNFSPHADGLTLHVKENESSKELVYRFECTDEGQGPIVWNFNEYIEAAS